MNPEQSESEGSRAPPHDARLRLATTADNDALLSLFSSVPMRGDLVLSTLRDPDFFGLYRMQGADAETWVFDEDGALGGSGTLLFRRGFLDGAPTTVGYLGDLRARFVGRRTLGFPRAFGERFDDAVAHAGCSSSLTAILASNTVALRALVKRHPRREQQPYYHLVRAFDAVSIHFTLPRLWTRSRFLCERASPADLPEIIELLARDHRQRAFGYRFDDGEFEHRLAHWPGYALDGTVVARDKNRRIVGVTTAWDAKAVKRYRVDAYVGALRVARHLYDVAAPFGGFSRMPVLGTPFRYFYLCNTSIVDDDPEILRALLETIYAEYRTSGHHFMTLAMDADDPLRPALRGFWRRGLRFHLYAVTSARERRTDFAGARTGFEMALA